MKQKMYSCDARVILSILIGLFLSCNVFAQERHDQRQRERCER